MLVRTLSAFLIGWVVYGAAFVQFALAAELSITPAVIDEKAKARDILKQSVTIKNTSDRKLNIYPSVNDIDRTEGEQAFVSAQDGSDREASLANWIELSRGVIELSPGEERNIPFVIRVNLNALPGSYHAQMTFSDGTDRASAEARGALVTVLVNLEVQADIKEAMQLSKFFTDNVFFSGDDVLFNVQLENIGNQALQPKGEIRIYNRKGEEVASVPVNADGKSVPPEELAQMASVWSAVNGFGKFKAFLTVDYGKSQTASVQDTVYFWIIPWKQLLGIFIGSFLAVILSAFYFHRWLEARHVKRFSLATAGVNVAVPAVIPETPSPKSKSRKSWLPRFSLSLPRRKQKASVDTAVSPAVHEPSAQIPAIKSPLPPAPVPIQEAPHPVTYSSSVDHGHTIDLKKMRSTGTSSSGHVASEGHVVNLKRK